MDIAITISTAGLFSEGELSLNSRELNSCKE